MSPTNTLNFYFCDQFFTPSISTKCCNFPSAFLCKDIGITSVSWQVNTDPDVSWLFLRQRPRGVSWYLALALWFLAFLKKNIAAFQKSNSTEVPFSVDFSSKSSSDLMSVTSLLQQKNHQMLYKGLHVLTKHSPYCKIKQSNIDAEIVWFHSFVFAPIKHQLVHQLAECFKQFLMFSWHLHVSTF